MKAADLANRVGSTVLPFTNPRVVCPPGAAGHHDRPNVVVATPMRSGTHLMIDLVLNNLPAYRVHPLYIDLDQCARRTVDGRCLAATISSAAGQVVKTHLPTTHRRVQCDADVERVVEDAVVVTVRRGRSAVMKSLSAWDRDAQDIERHAADFDAFWTYWSGRQSIEVAFEDLFDPARVSIALLQIAKATGTRSRRHLVMPVPARRRRRIYFNKGMTRLAGHRSPRIDTTIHTLKG